MDLPWEHLHFMGMKWFAPKDVPPELEGLVIAQTESGYPTSVIREDGDWLRFAKECSAMKNESNWTLTGGQVPTAFTTKALRLQLSRYNQPAGYARDPEAFEDATQMLEDALLTEIGPIHEITLHESFFGTNDGLLAGLPLDTSCGVGWSKLSTDKLGIVEDPEKLSYFLDVVAEDYRRLEDEDETHKVWTWPTKSSLKDARLPAEKVANNKARIFNGASFPVSINGRRLVGDFIGKFMKRCAEGSFFGIVSFVLARGGWDAMMQDLTQGDPTTKLYDFDIKWFDKDFIREFHFRITRAIARLAGSYRLARMIMRHYERVWFSPTLVAIFGLLFYCCRGQPSGDIATVIINTLAQILVYMYIYCKTVPKSMRTYRQFNENIRLKLLGDDSASALNPHYEARLNVPWITLVCESFMEFGWTVEMPRDPPKPVTLDEDFTFVGHMCIKAEVPTHNGRRVIYLPALPFSVLLSINEYKKLSKNQDVPEPVRHIGRYYASYERAFPYLFSNDPIEKSYVPIAKKWLDMYVAKYRNSPNELVRATAAGVPTLGDLVRLYFPEDVEYRLIEGELRQQLALDPGQG